MKERERYDENGRENKTKVKDESDGIRSSRKKCRYTLSFVKKGYRMRYHIFSSEEKLITLYDEIIMVAVMMMVAFISCNASNPERKSLR